MPYRRANSGAWLTACCGLVLGLTVLFAPAQGAAAVGTAGQYAAAVAAGVGDWQRTTPTTRARPPAPHTGGRAAPSRPPAGLSFTGAHGCNPAADWPSRHLDPRVRALLVGVAAAHRVRVSCLHTGHSRYVKGTRRVSNHTVWRAVDIDLVDGQPVSRANLAAHHLAAAIGRGEFGVQPSEVGSPWSFGRRPWFTDAGHQGHLHVGFSG